LTASPQTLLMLGIKALLQSIFLRNGTCFKVLLMGSAEILLNLT